MSCNQSDENVKSLSQYFSSYLNDVNRDKNPDLEKQIDFDLWAETYESDEQFFDCNLHIKFVDFLEKIVTRENKNIRSLAILDLGAGTGLVGQELRERGHAGPIDALDGSEQMLNLARRKEVYQRTFYHIVRPNKKLPDDVISSFYDVVTVCGSMHQTCITADCIYQYINCVQINGLIVFSVRIPSTWDMFEYRVEVEKECFSLEEQGYWKLVELELCKNYRKKMINRDAENEHPPGMILYCYKKLKNLDLPK